VAVVIMGADAGDDMRAECYRKGARRLIGSSLTYAHGMCEESSGLACLGFCGR
jgi:hypothetical protein